MSKLLRDGVTVEDFDYSIYRIGDLLEKMIVFENFQPPEMTPFSVCLDAAEEHMKDALRLDYSGKASVNKCPQTVSMKRITSFEELSTLATVPNVKTNKSSQISTENEVNSNSQVKKQSPTSKRSRSVRFAKNLVKVAYLPQKHMITARNSRKGTVRIWLKMQSILSFNILEWIYLHWRNNI